MFSQLNVENYLDRIVGQNCSTPEPFKEKREQPLEESVSGSTGDEDDKPLIEAFPSLTKRHLASKRRFYVSPVGSNNQKSPLEGRPSDQKREAISKGTGSKEVEASKGHSTKAIKGNTTT